MKKAILALIPLFLFSLIIFTTVKDASTVPVSQTGQETKCTQIICVQDNGSPVGGCEIIITQGGTEVARGVTNKHGCISFRLYAGIQSTVTAGCLNRSEQFTSCTAQPIIFD